MQLGPDNHISLWRLKFHQLGSRGSLSPPPELIDKQSHIVTPSLLPHTAGLLLIHRPQYWFLLTFIY